MTERAQEPTPGSAASAPKMRVHFGGFGLNMGETRAALHAQLQAESPLPLRLELIPLPGGYTILDDEFVVRTSKEWGMSSQPVVLTTQRLIFSAAKGATVIRLQDITAVTYRKSLVGYASVVVEVAAGGRVILPAYVNGQQVRGDIAAMVEFAGRSS